MSRPRKPVSPSALGGDFAGTPWSQPLRIGPLCTRPPGGVATALACDFVIRGQLILRFMLKLIQRGMVRTSEDCNRWSADRVCSPMDLVRWPVPVCRVHAYRLVATVNPGAQACA